MTQNDPASDASPIQTTTINKQWVVKTGLVLAMGLVMGVWGLLDAMVWYPARGVEDASYKQRVYLERARRAGTLETASIPDPASKRGTLTFNRDKLEKAAAEAQRLESIAASGSGRDAQQAEVDLRKIQGDVVDGSALMWLDALQLVGRLDRSYTEMQVPGEELKKLEAKWSKTQAPLPLNAYDIPVQWLITSVGFLVALYVIVRMYLPAMRTKYTWEPGPQRLTLPDGRKLTPADIAEFDKRLWDKLYIQLHLKESAGGGTLKLDLLRYVPLEEWILTMERTAFPETAPPAPAAAAGEGVVDGQAAAPAGNEPAANPKN